MNSPYFNTNLHADIRLRPSQMNNNLLEEIKQNLNQKLSNKCYKNYGYIDVVYDIDENIQGGYIRAEDNTASSLHKVKFSCRLINPIIRGHLIAKIVGINNKMIIASDGPIIVIIGSKNINSKNIIYHNTAYYPLNESGKIINKAIVKDSYVKIKVFNKEIINGRDKILTIGTMESVASDDEVKRYMKLKYPDKETESEEILNMKIEEELVDMDNDTESEDIESKISITSKSQSRQTKSKTDSKKIDSKKKTMDKKTIDKKTIDKKLIDKKSKKDLETDSISSNLTDLSDLSDLSDDE